MGLPDAQGPVPGAGAVAPASGSTVTQAVAERRGTGPGDGDVGHAQLDRLLGHGAERLIELRGVADAAVEGQGDVQVGGRHRAVAHGE